MKVSSEQLKELKRIYREQFGQELTDQVALELAQKLLGLVKIIYKPIRQVDLEKADKAKEIL